MSDTDSTVDPDPAEYGATRVTRAAGSEEASDDEFVVELVGVTKEYRSASETVVALDDVDFTVRPGEFVAVVGPSGSGKSTMLNVLGLLDVPTRGEQYLQERDVTDLTDEEQTDARKRAIGFVFQDFHLIPTLTATENVELPTLFDGRVTENDDETSDRTRDLLSRVGLGDRLDHDPTQLSGGQKQRVAIARALVNHPALVLADEPTGNLDRETGTTILEEFRRICEEGVAVVAVTHDDLVTGFADRTVELVDGAMRHSEGSETGEQREQRESGQRATDQREATDDRAASADGGSGDSTATASNTTRDDPDGSTGADER